MRRAAGRACLLLFAMGLFPQSSLPQINPVLPSVALKSGESIELADLAWAVNCRSILKGTPVAEVLEGPKEVTVTVREAMVVPRVQNCNQPVKGGKLVLTANEVDDYSTSKLTVRITYQTRDGERKYSLSYNISLFPKQN